MKKERIEELWEEYDLYNELDWEHFTEFIGKIEKELKLEWYKKLLTKLEFIYGSDLKVFGGIIDKNANNYYKEIQEKIKGLEDGN